MVQIPTASASTSRRLADEEAAIPIRSPLLAIGFRSTGRCVDPDVVDGRSLLLDAAINSSHSEKWPSSSSSYFGMAYRSYWPTSRRIAAEAGKCFVRLEQGDLRAKVLNEEAVRFADPGSALNHRNDGVLGRRSRKAAGIAVITAELEIVRNPTFTMLQQWAPVRQPLLSRQGEVVAFRSQSARIEA